MEQLLKLLDTLLDKLKTLIVLKNAPTLAGKKLFEKADELANLGIDVSPLDIASDEYGCVESLEQVYFRTFGEYLGGGISTIRLKWALLNNKKFVKVTSPIAGDIILSVTGEGGRNGIGHGHCGIMGQGKIMSNNSKTGKWEYNYDIFQWKWRWETIGGYPTYYFRKVL